MLKNGTAIVRRESNPPAGEQNRGGIVLVRDPYEVPDQMTKTRTCPKCGSDRMRVVAKSDSPLLTFLKCELCGFFHSTNNSGSRLPPRD